MSASTRSSARSGWRSLVVRITSISSCFAMVLRFRTEDVIEAGQGGALVAEEAEELQRIGDATAGEGVDADVGLVFVGSPRCAPPIRGCAFRSGSHPDEGNLEMQAGFVLLGGRRVDRIAHGIAELGQHHLFGLVDGENGAADDEQAGKGGEGDETAGAFALLFMEWEGDRGGTRGSPAARFTNCSRGRSVGRPRR